MTEKGAKRSDDLHKEIANKLRFGGIPKDRLDELVNIVAQIHQQGLSQFNVFPKGRPVADTLEVSGLVSAANIGSVLNGILNKVPNYTGVVVFPYGIPFPEIFQVNVQVGGVPEEGGA